ncbi:MAG: DUF4838 domain-containing protein [Opitutaceae bacterium]
MSSLRTAYLLALLPLSLFGAIERSAFWRPERELGSASLKLLSLESVALSSEVGSKLQAAVNDLQSVFVDQVGKELAVLDGEHYQKQAIVLQIDESMSRNGGFSIRRQRSSLLIRAASEDGLCNAIYALCSDVFGARWYWSGDLGLEYVTTAPSSYPVKYWRDSPAFVQRRLHPVETDFGRRNRLNHVYQFNHALAKVFNKSMFYLDEEAFSVVKGRKREPKGHGGTDPQPNLAHPRAVEIAAEAAIEYFESHPYELSYSLSINDNVMFDETPLTEAQVTPLKYFRTRPDYTDYVFRFNNAVAEKVFDEAGLWQAENGEDRYLTALSYFWTEPSPSIAIHPRVVPVLTSDRAQWHDSDYRSEDKALIHRWANTGNERVATWDYYFGAPYPYPRQFNQWMVESLRHLSEEGVDIFYSQLPSVWGLDGAKAWLASELLWDPSRDADSLLDEYYTHFFGAAAGSVRSFYEVAEAHRNKHEGKADWIKFYKDEAGVGLFSEEVLQNMRASIETAKLEVAADPRRLARVEVVSEAFRFTESYAAFHCSRGELVEAIMSGSPSTRSALDVYQTARTAYYEIADLITAQPMHSRLKTFSTQLQSDPSPMAVALLAKRGQLSEESDEYGLINWAQVDAMFESIFDNVELNHEGSYRVNFLGPDLPVVPGWYFDFRPSEHLKVVAGEESGKGIRVSGADVFSIFWDQPIEADRSYLLDTKMGWCVSPDNRTLVKLIWRDADGRHLRTEIPLQLPWGDSSGMQQIVIPFKSPKNATQVRIHFVSSRQYAGDYLELQNVDFGVWKAK